MGCGGSKATKTAPAEKRPLEASRSVKSTLSSVVDDAQAAQVEHKASTISTTAVQWAKLATAVNSGKYAAWDNIELPLEAPEDDHFDHFEGEQDDYTMFMTETRAACDHEVTWSGKMLNRLNNDKTARGGILRDAKEYGDSLDGLQDRHITVIYNPVGGGGKAKKMVSHMVVPVLQLCKMKFKVLPTERRRHAVELVENLDINSTDGIIVCGGDGLVHEVITGYFLHPDQEGLHKKVKVGITPCGTANAMANALHTHPNKSQLSIIGRATLAVAKGQTRKVDVIKCVQQPDEESEELNTGGPIETYALSCFGWGMAGAVALKADKLRWIPGQKSARYDIAGFVSLISDWPVADKGMLEYREHDGSPEGAPWAKKEISLINMITSNLDKQGKKYPILPGIRPDDGMVCMSYIESTCSRSQVVKLGLGMKKGKYLGLQKGVTTHKCTEFKITPTAYKSPYVIDGDPHDVSEIHVKVLHQALALYYLPAEDESGSAKNDEALSNKSLYPVNAVPEHAENESGGGDAIAEEATPADAKA